MNMWVFKVTSVKCDKDEVTIIKLHITTIFHLTMQFFFS